MQSYLQERSRPKALHIRYLVVSTLKYFNTNFQYTLGLHVVVIRYFISQTARISTSIGYPLSQVQCSTYKHLCFYLFRLIYSFSA